MCPSSITRRYSHTFRNVLSFCEAESGLLDHFNLQNFRLLLIVLSSNKKVLVATEAVKRLLAGSDADPWQMGSLVDCSLAELGVNLFVEEGCKGQDLSTMLDEMAWGHPNGAGTSLPSSALSTERNEKRNSRKHGSLTQNCRRLLVIQRGMSGRTTGVIRHWRFWSTCNVVRRVRALSAQSSLAEFGPRGVPPYIHPDVCQNCYVAILHHSVNRVSGL